MSRRHNQKDILRLKEVRKKTMLDRFGNELRANGAPQPGQVMPFPVVCQGSILVAPVTKLCWEQYFGIVQQHFRPGMTRAEKKQFADDAMEMAIVACARIGGVVSEDVPAGWRDEEKAAPEEGKGQGEDVLRFRPGPEEE